MKWNGTITEVEIYGTNYVFMRSPKCSYKVNFNRMVKLATMFEELSDKFDGMINRGIGVTDLALCALACKMMMYTGIRIGNEASAEGYTTNPHPNSKAEPKFVQTYGLTTMLREHAYPIGRRVKFRFLGKRYMENTFEVGGLLAKQVKELMKNYHGETLFGVTDYELTKFVKKYVGRHFMPKDFRTLRANMVACEALAEIEDRELPHTKSEYNAEVKEVATAVSEELNNTVGVCKRSYIDDLFWEYMASARPIVKRGGRR